MAYMALLFVLLWSEVLISRLVKSSGLSEWNLQAVVYVSICVSIIGVWTDSIPLSTCCMPPIKMYVVQGHLGDSVG